MASDPTDLLQALKDSLVRRCRDCDEPVDRDGVTRGECGGGSGEKCPECFGCTCDGSC